MEKTKVNVKVSAEPSKKNQPEKKFRASPITATIWANDAISKSGEKVTFKTITMERSYKDKDDKWQTTNSLRLNDLPKAALVLSKAYEYLVIKESDSHNDGNGAEDRDEIF